MGDSNQSVQDIVKPVELDRELASLDGIVKLLNGLDPDKQARILGYLIERFPVQPLRKPEVLKPGDLYFRFVSDGWTFFKRPMGHRIS